MSVRVLCVALAAAAYWGSSVAQSIQEIQGSSFYSPYAGKSVTGVRGVVTAKGPSGFWLTASSDGNVATSDSVYVYSTSATVLGSVKSGDEVTLNGKVSEYVSSSTPADLHLTEIGSPTAITVLSSGNPVIPIILGKDRTPPTIQYSAYDSQNIFSYPGNKTLQDSANATLQPTKYGLDFWESLEGALVTVPLPTVLAFPSSYGDFWVRGAWPITGQNARGGLSITVSNLNPAPVTDANPEAIIIGAPLDGTKNPKVKLGDTVTNITGVVTYVYSYYTILPLTAPTILSSLAYNPPRSSFSSSTAVDASGCQRVTFADYNIENFTPNSPTRLALAASHIVDYLDSPDILWLQEIQDNNGATDNGIVSANLTLSAITAAIVKAGGPTYSFITVDPIDGTNGGEPGGNIRPAYLYKPGVVSLVDAPAGDSLVGTSVVGTGATASLTLNPGLIDPLNAAFNASRKPLVALFNVTATGSKLWAINVHQSSKGGSTGLHQNPRPPVNGAIDGRIAQAKVTANFIGQVLAADPKANLIIAGDFNEYRPTTVVFDPYLKLVTPLDDVVGYKKVESYTYLFDGNSQQLDHALITQNLKPDAEFEHIHVNTWANGTTTSLRLSDHDPSVGRVKVCGV